MREMPNARQIWFKFPKLWNSIILIMGHIRPLAVAQIGTGLPLPTALTLIRVQGLGYRVFKIIWPSCLATPTPTVHELIVRLYRLGRAIYILPMEPIIKSLPTARRRERPVPIRWLTLAVAVAARHFLSTVLAPRPGKQKDAFLTKRLFWRYLIFMARKARNIGISTRARFSALAFGPESDTRLEVHSSSASTAKPFLPSSFI